MADESGFSILHFLTSSIDGHVELFNDETKNRVHLIGARACLAFNVQRSFKRSTLFAVKLTHSSRQQQRPAKFSVFFFFNFMIENERSVANYYIAMWGVFKMLQCREPRYTCCHQVQDRRVYALCIVAFFWHSPVRTHAITSYYTIVREHRFDNFGHRRR